LFRSRPLPVAGSGDIALANAFFAGHLADLLDRCDAHKR